VLTDILIAAGWTRDRAAGCWYAPGDPDTPLDDSEAYQWVYDYIAASWTYIPGRGWELAVPHA